MRSLLDDTPWAVRECAEAELGDLRRTQRGGARATALAQHPTASGPEACGTGARLKAASRFFAPDAIEPQDLLRSPTEATASRLAQVPLVLAVHDTTEVDWTAPPATPGLGPLGHTTGQGLQVHRTLAVTPERVPLGLLAPQVWATVAAQPVAESLRVQVPRRGTQPGREALLRLRCCPLTRCPPRHRQRAGWPAGARWAVQVRADEPPTTVEPSAWLLLTTVAGQTVDDAIERVTGYACRWGMEIV